MSRERALLEEAISNSANAIKANHSLMEKRGQATDRHGRIWTARVISHDEAEEEDFRFWYEELTPEERVRAVEDCTLSALKAKGINEIPRLQKVCRVIKRSPR